MAQLQDAFEVGTGVADSFVLRMVEGEVFTKSLINTTTTSFQDITRTIERTERCNPRFWFRINKAYRDIKFVAMLRSLTTASAYATLPRVDENLRKAVDAASRRHWLRMLWRCASCI